MNAVIDREFNFEVVFRVVAQEQPEQTTNIQIENGQHRVCVFELRLFMPCNEGIQQQHRQGNHKGKWLKRNEQKAQHNATQQCTQVHGATFPDVATSNDDND